MYLDDILVHGESFEAALGSLRCVLGMVARAGLKLHPQKYCFMRREVTFLRHRLGGTMSDKVQAVKDPLPSLYKN